MASSKDISTTPQTFHQVRQILQAMPDYILPDGSREWVERSVDPTTTVTTGNWSLFFKSGGLFLKDDAGTVTGPLVDAASSGGLTSAYADMTDGTTTASASGGDTFKFRTANGILTIAVGSNDATHGDNALFTLVQSAIDHGSIGGLSDIADHPDYLTKDGSRPLTSDWDAGSFKVTARTLKSDVSIGTSPLEITSTTVVANLNSDLLDGEHATAFANTTHTHESSDVSDFETEKDLYSFATKTADYTMVASDDVILADATSGDVKITLPNVVSSSGKKFEIKRISTNENTVTLSAV